MVLRVSECGKVEDQEIIGMLRRRNTRENVWRIRKAELGESRVGWLGLRRYSTRDLRHVYPEASLVQNTAGSAVERDLKT